MATFTPAAWSFQPTVENFLAVGNLVKPERNAQVIRQRQRVYLSDILMAYGAYQELPTGNLEYIHNEESFTYPKIKATTAGAGAGALASFSLSSTNPNQQFAVSQQDPYLATSPATYVGGVPARKDDYILIKPSAGYSGATNVIHARIASVNETAGTFTAYPIDGAISIPAIATAQEIIILGAMSTEIGGSKRSLTNDLLEYSNNVSFFQDSCEISNVAADMFLWTQLSAEGNYWGNYQDEKCFERVKQGMNNVYLFGKKITNTTLASTTPTDPMLQGNGIITEVLANGVTQNYTSLTGFGIPEIEQLGAKFEAENVTKDFMFIAGYNLRTSLSRNFADYLKNGAVTYGMFSGNEDKNIDLDFDALQYSGYNYQIIQTSLLSDAQTFNANGFNYIDEGVLLPAGMRRDTVTGGSVPMVQIRYVGSELLETVSRDNAKINGRFSMSTEYRSASGVEVFGAVASAYISKV